MGEFTPINSLPPLNPSQAARPVPFREDCWSEEATGTLVEAWGQRYLELNRGNLRQKDWQEVADAVNSRHGQTKKSRRTDVQCKNRIDTIKKKYKSEKARVVETSGAFVSSWPFFDKLDVLIGVKKSEAFSRRTSIGYSGFGIRRAEAGTRTPPMLIALRREPQRERLPLAVAVAVTPQKRTAPVVDDSYFRRNYSAMAAAAAKGEVEDEYDYDEDFSEDEEMDESGDDRVDEKEVKQGRCDGMMMLAKAIDGFAQMYERVEMEKLKQAMDLEKKWIEIGKKAEMQRTHLFEDLQAQVDKLMRDKNKSSGLDGEKSDIYS